MAAPTELFRDEFSVYFRDDERRAIEQRWTRATKDMSEQQFRDGISRLAQFLERTQMPHALVDVTQMEHAPADDFEPWRQANIIPRYNAAGVKKFAFLMAQDYSATAENGTTPAPEGAANFPTGYFRSRDAVAKWFDGSSD